MFEYQNDILYIFCINKLIDVRNDYISVSSKNMILDIKGNDLLLASFEDKEISIKGNIDNISIIKINARI